MWDETKEDFVTDHHLGCFFFTLFLGFGGGAGALLRPSLYWGVAKPCPILPNLSPQPGLLSKAVEELAEKGQSGATAVFPGVWVVSGFPDALD